MFRSHFNFISKQDKTSHSTALITRPTHQGFPQDVDQWRTLNSKPLSKNIRLLFSYFFWKFLCVCVWGGGGGKVIIVGRISHQGKPCSPVYHSFSNHIFSSRYSLHQISSPFLQAEQIPRPLINNLQHLLRIPLF